MMKKKLYISLPITGYQLSERKEYAEIMKRQLALVFPDHEVITPFDICPEEGKPYSYYMGKCIEVLITCDIVKFCNGWERSKGCMAEFEVAKIYGKEIRM